jgi:glycine/D-amino acid oxidase-like deaminating enzyme
MPESPSIWSFHDSGIWPALAGDAKAEVCVIGGGIAGLTTAYRLAAGGAAVILIDAGEIGGGETARTSAHLASALDDRFTELERLHGRHGARIAAESHAAAIDFIEQTTRAHGIACAFARVNGYLFLAVGDTPDLLRAEQLASSRAGLTVALLDQGPSGLRLGPCLRFAHQAQFEPLIYLRGLANAAVSLGVVIHSHTRAMDIRGDRKAVEIRTDHGRITAGAVVVATNVPINDRLRVHTWLEAYRSYVIAVRAPTTPMERALYWDTGDPYHYVRFHAATDGDLMIVGGEDHRTGQGPADADLPYRNLERWLRLRWPEAGPLVRRWSGQIIEPVDGLALIGRNPLDAENVFIITGDSGNGLTHGTLGGMLVGDLILSGHSPWEELYRPSRITLAASGEFARHNANVLAQYADWIGPAAASSIADVRPGTSALVRHGLSKWAVHRDAAGKVHVCSAVCPHLGGLVRWNAGEGTWDCPCHGSRFGVDGSVINGPANTGLERIAPPAQDTAVTAAGKANATERG